MNSSTDASSDKPRKRLFRRYFAFIGGGISVVLLLAIAVDTPISYRSTLDRVGDVQAAEAQSAATRVDEFLRSVENALRESASIPWESRAFHPADGRAEQYRLMKLIPSLDSIQWVDAEGRVTQYVSRRELDRPPGAAFRNRDLLARAERDGAALGEVEFRSGIEPVVALAVHVPRARRHAVAELNLRNVGDIVTQSHVGTAGRAFLVGRDQRIVAHPDPAKTMGKPSEALVRQLAEIRSRLSKSGIAAPAEGRNADDVQVLATAVALPRWGWIVVAEEPLEAALQPVRLTLYRMVALLVAGVLLALLLSVVLARRLTRPIRSLQEGAERIARGDLQSRLDVRTGDEVESVARAFNHMAGQLEDYTTGLERKVQEKTSALQEAMRARELFLAAASHDLRQPLYAISILGDALALKAIPDDAREVLSKQRQAIGILRSLFDNLLDLSRFEAGEVRKGLRDVSLRDVLAATAVEFEVLSQAKGLRWECELPDAWVRTDPELLRRLSANLLSNAVRYTQHGTVRMSGVVSGSAVALTVSDTGVGIPREDQERVFQEFVQLENPARERDRGVGLGLSIVRKINELLDSGLQLESEPGKGTRVTFRIPLAEAPAQAASPEIAHAAAADFPGARVWVVEDDPVVRTALAIQLDEWAIDHDFALDREQILALREADGEWPAAVVLDDMLGHGERGLELARWLAERMEAERILLVTGNVEPARVLELQDSGFKVLRKPVASAVLAQALGDALRAARSAPAGAPAG
jgi:signal transduction histidine kinase/ActR/RegA family two-component response regulator